MVGAYPAPPPPPNVRRGEAVTARQVALIGAIATVVAAGLAILAAFISGNIAAKAVDRQIASAAEALDREIASEAEQKRAEFLRNQRQEAFSSVLSNINQLEWTAWELGNVLSAGEVDNAEANRLYRQYQTQYPVFLNGIFTVELIGSSTVPWAQKIKELYYTQLLAVNQVPHVSSPPYVHPSTGATRAQIADQLYQDQKKFDELIAGFKAAAREDLK